MKRARCPSTTRRRRSKAPVFRIYCQAMTARVENSPRHNKALCVAKKPRSGVPFGLAGRLYIRYIRSVNVPHRSKSFKGANSETRRALETKTFKSGNSVALRLPKSLAIGPDEKMLIERNGDVLTVRRVKNAAAERKKVLDLVEALRKMGPVGEIEKRESLEFPERPGLI